MLAALVPLVAVSCLSGDYDFDAHLADIRAREIAATPSWGVYLRHDSLVIDSIARTIDTDSLFRIKRRMANTRSPHVARTLFQAHMCENHRLTRAYGFRPVERATEPGVRPDWSPHDEAAYEAAPVPAGMYGLSDDECGKASGPAAPDSVSGVSLSSEPYRTSWKEWKPIAGQDSLLRLMSSDSIPVRMRAYEALMTTLYDNLGSDTGKSARVAWSWRAKRDGRVALAIIRSLERENVAVHDPNGNYDEEYSEYYASLIHSVAGLRDVRAVNALVGAIGTGMMAAEGLAYLGDAALPPLERLARSTDRSERFTAAHVFSLIAKRRGPKTFDLSSDGVERVKQALLRLQGDSYRHARETAIEGLRHFPD